MAAKYILLPVDGSVTAEAAARFAEDIARAEGSTILVLGVTVLMTFSHEDNRPLEAAIRTYMTETVATEAARIRSAGVTAEELVVDAASPHEGILAVAERRDADLIVMGTHGRGALARAVIGSVADRVVRHASIPVLLVPLKVAD